MAKGKVLLGDELMHPSDFVCAEDLKGRDANVTIAGISKDDVFLPKAGKAQPAPVLRFAETPKKLVLNKTNANTIASLHGTQAKEWVGKRITLYPTTCKVKGEETTCIRIRPKVPPAKGAKPDPAPVTNEKPPEPAPETKPEPEGCAPGKAGCAEDGARRNGVYWCSLHDPENA